MSKQEFLDGLRRALSATGNEPLIVENISYYNSYIDAEIAKTRTEVEVLGELGDPRLIAKSIMDAAGYDDDVFMEAQSSGSDAKSDSSEYRNENADNTDRNRNSGAGNMHMYNMSGWKAKLIPIVLIIIVVSIIWMVGTIIGGIFTLLSPILGPILMIVVVMWFIQIFHR